MEAINIKEIEGYDAMVALHPLILELNADLSLEHYREMLLEMIPKDYRQVGAFVNNVCVGVAGFWIKTKLYCGKYLEADNVIVSEKYRSLKLGTKLMHWMHDEAVRLGCNVCVLDVYVQNKDAHRFYNREGYSILGFHMIKKLK